MAPWVASSTWVLLRVDLPAGLPIIEFALAEARRVDDPVALPFNLRSRAFAQILLDDAVGATATVAELLADLLRRGALTDATLLVDVTAALAYHRDHPWWETLAATSRALPISTSTIGQNCLVLLPATDAPPIARHDVIAVVRNVLADLSSLPSVTAPTDPDAEPAAALSGSIRRLGDICEITFNGRTATVRAAKGVHDLIRLIDAAGREVHCLDLVGAGVEQPSTGELVDARARRQYEQRIRELQTDIEEAENNSDYARAYKLQVEFDAIIDHLTAAVGQGNRNRRAADTAEKSRSAVTHRVRSTMRQLGKLHPALGRHLDHAINTGTYCSYRPEQTTTWQID